MTGTPKCGTCCITLDVKMPKTTGVTFCPTQDSSTDIMTHAGVQVGGRFGGIFDEDPRRWRMLGEVFATLGQGLEIATGFFPGE